MKKFLGVCIVLVFGILLLTGCKTSPVTTIAMKELPSRVSYVTGEKIDLNGAKIEVSHENGKTSTMLVISSMTNLNEIDMTFEGKKTVSVKHKAKETFFEINVAKKPISVVLDLKKNNMIAKNGAVSIDHFGMVVGEFDKTVAKRVTLKLDFGNFSNSNIKTTFGIVGNSVQILAEDDYKPGVFYNVVKNGFSSDQKVNKLDKELFLLANQAGSFDIVTKVVDVASSKEIAQNVTTLTVVD